MKTKIVYISGNEVFDVKDIRAAFEEVRNALNLDKTTVLFGVPVDADDAGLMDDKQPETIAEEIPEPVEIIKEETEIIIETPQEIIDEPVAEPIVEEAPKKRGRPHKEKTVEEPVATEFETTDSDEKVVPILSVLSTKSESDDDTVVLQETEEVEIIPEISEEKTEEIIDEETIADEEESSEEDDDEADLEKLLSAMTPLAEDVMEEKENTEPVAKPIDDEEDVSVDATLEQLATEFAETQDKIATENKSSRSKIGKLRNILPFKQSKHKDQGLGDLFGWAGVAANDEDFSVPGFFTNAASKK